MSEKSASPYTLLHVRLKLRVPPHAFLTQCREAAAVIASVEGLIWKIWALQEEQSEIGGLYLFANRETADAYLSLPIFQAVRSNPAVVSTQSHLWDIDNSLSALTRAPLQGLCAQSSQPAALVAGGQ